MEDSKDPDEFWTAQFQSRMLATEGITASSPRNTTARAQDVIDLELDAMCRLITVAKMRRNAIAPISRLPRETLSHVFAMLAAVDPPGARTTWVHGSAPNVGWIRITHVCRQWRGLALADARLWSRITLGLSPRWVLELLWRSESMPLTFDAEVRTEGRAYVDAVLAEVADRSYVRRLRAFRFTSIYLDHVEAALQRLIKPAPALESLELRYTAGYDWEDALWPESVFASSLPRLRRLTLEGWVPQWDAPYLRDLTALELTMPRHSQVHQIMDMTKCLEILRASPLLESLVLTQVVRPSAEGDADPDLAHLALPRLKTLTLRCGAAEILVLVRVLDVPFTCTVEVAFLSSHEHTSALLAELAPFAGGPDDAPCAPLRTLSIECNKLGRTREKYLCVQCWDVEDHTGHVPKLSIEYEDLSDTWLGMLQEFVERMHTDAVGALSISGPEILRLKKTALLDLLRCFPTVQSLSLVGPHAAGVVSVLGQATKGSGKKTKSAVGDRPLVLPALQHIRIGKAVFDRRGAGGRSTFGGVLHGVLLARRTFNAPIASLRLKNCEYVQGALDVLRDCVETLESERPRLQRPE